MRGALAALLLATCMLLIALLPLVFAQANKVTFYVYGEAGCPACGEAKKLLSSLYGPESVVYRDIYAFRQYYDDYEKLYKMLGFSEMGIPLTIVVVDGEPKAAVMGARDEGFWRTLVSTCTLVKGLLVVDSTGRERVVKKLEIISAVKSIVVSRAAGGLVVEKRADRSTAHSGEEVRYTVVAFNNGSVTLNSVVLIDELPEGVQFVSANVTTMVREGVLEWRIGSLKPGEKVAIEYVVYIPQNIEGVLLNTVTAGGSVGGSTVTSTYTSTLTVVKRSDWYKALPVVITMALADSVNPCTFSVFTALLLIASALAGRRRALAVGAPFIAAIYVAYYAMGLGLIKIFYYIPYIKYLVIALALVFGASSLLSGVGGRFKSPIPSRLRRVIESMIERAVNPVSAAIAGFVISFTLLPCTSGPYLVATALLARIESPAVVYALLGLYNAIFVLPLVGILLGVTLLSLKARTLKVWRSKHLAEMEMVSGALLIIIAIYLALAL